VTKNGIPYSCAYRLRRVGGLSPARQRSDKLGIEMNRPNDELTAHELEAVSGGDMSMRLQMAMDQRSKVVETLSNVLKKIDETADQIVQNLK
jgi:hypothetical protein